MAICSESTAGLSIAIDCTAAQSKILRGILREVGVYGVITVVLGAQRSDGL